MSLPQQNRHPVPVLTIEIIGYIGVAFWATMIVRAWLDGSASAIWVTLLGIVLGGAHIVIAVGAAQRRRIAFAAMWFVVVSDTLLTIFVDVKAIVLVGATILMLILTRTRSAREWWG